MSAPHKKVYEQELVRLQAELVKMQYWVRAEGARIAVVFEGRDAAGKGGSIRRIMEYLNPRSCRVAAPPEADRARADPVVLPALHLASPGGRRDRAVRPQLVQPRRRRDGDGLLHPEEHARFLRQTPIFERMLVEDGIILLKYWFSVSDEEQERRFQSRHRRPDAALEAQPDGPPVARALGRVLAREGRDVRLHRHPRGAGSSSKATTSAPRASTASTTS